MDTKTMNESIDYADENLTQEDLEWVSVLDQAWKESEETGEPFDLIMGRILGDL